MNKSFLFDMDGVLVDSELTWEQIERERFPSMFGADIALKMPNLIGAGVEKVLDIATSLGATFDRDEAARAYDEIAGEVYRRSPVIGGTNELVQVLKPLGFRFGVVSQTKQNWIEDVVARLAFKDDVECIVSLYAHPELQPKPAPDGYLAALRELDADPNLSYVLEDSNTGIAAGKGAGCYVIGFKGTIFPDYVQQGADEYAETMQQVGEIVQRRLSQQ